MSKAKILVTGASGKTGNETVRALLERGFDVRALVHREDARSNQLRQQGAETVVGNMLAIDDMMAAMKGVERAYFVCPWTADQLDISLNFAVAAAENHVQHIVATSQWLSSASHVSVATRRTWLLDRVLSWLPETTCTLMNVGFFADNYMALLEPISQLGMFALPLGNGANAPVSNGDIGRSIAAALAEPEKHAGKTYRPCGPALLTPTQIADAFGSVLGRNVKYEDVSENMFLKATTAMGIPIGLLSQLRHYFAEYRAGTFAEGAPNDAVLYLTGRPPEDFETIVRSYVDDAAHSTGFQPSVDRTPPTQRTARNKARALANVVRLLLTPVPKISDYERDRLPQISNARSAPEHEDWTQSHAVENAFGSEQTPSARPEKAVLNVA